MSDIRFRVLTVVFPSVAYVAYATSVLVTLGLFLTNPYPINQDPVYNFSQLT